MFVQWTCTGTRTNRSVGVLHSLGLLLGEHSDAEVSVEVWLKCGRDDQVLSWRQFEASADLSQVDESFGLRRLSVAQEEVLVQVHLPLPVELKGDNGQSGHSYLDRRANKHCLYI